MPDNDANVHIGVIVDFAGKVNNGVYVPYGPFVPRPNSIDVGGEDTNLFVD